MSTWNAVVTNEGKKLQAKILNGETLEFTKIVSGMGRNNDITQLIFQTKVLEENRNLTLQEIKTEGDTTSVMVILDNLGLETSYELQQIGFYVKNPEGKEDILYCIAQIDEGRIIPSDAENKGYSISWRFHFKSSENMNFGITIDPKGIISQEIFEEHQKNSNSQIMHVTSEEKSVYTDKYTKKEIDSKLESLLDRIYPVGSIYTSVTNVNPSIFLKGTWQRFGNGRTLIGIDENDSYFNGSQKTGGQKNATVINHNHNIAGLNCNASGNHSHSVTNVKFYDKSVAKGESYARWNSSGNKTTTWGTVSYSGNHQHWVPAHSTDWKGEDGTGKNLPPYICVYFWKRTA